MRTLWVVGDSTLSCFSDNYYYPRYGYGTKLSVFLNDKVEVRNIALSGRSSLSFTKEKEYEELINNMNLGDFLLIGFGHNDEKAEKDRFTSPIGDYKKEGSFANSLYCNYIEPARESGVIPILCTPIVRRKTDKEWPNVCLHITEDNGEFKGGDYSEVIRKLGRDVDVDVIDMTSITKKLYDKMGVENSAYLHAWSCDNILSTDNTHTNAWGALVNAFFVMKDIKELGIKGLSENILDLSKYMPYPAKEDYLVENKDYVAIKFNSDLPESNNFKDVCGFRASVFGDIIGSIDNDFVIKEEKYNEKSAIRMIVKNNRGKIGTITDGIAFVFKQIKADTKFKLTVKIKINDYFSNDQVSFGLMVRDDVYIDKDSADVLGDYVAAAPLLLTRKENACECFARRSSKLVYGNKLRRELKPGMIVNAMLFATEDGYGACFDDGDTITGGFDFKLVSIDPLHVYVGMFASRNVDVTFFDINYEEM